MEANLKQSHPEMNNVEEPVENETQSDNDENKDKENITETTFDFTVQTWKEDFALVVENKKLFVTKAILAIASPVFEQMFTSEFKEKDTDELELPGKKFADVQEFLLCIYPGLMASVTRRNVYRVLPLAEEYQVTGLKAKCEEFLRTSLNELSVDEVYDVLSLSSTYNMEDLLTRCIEMVSEKPIGHLDRAVKRKSSFPLNAVCDIQNKMMKRLEKSEVEKRWFEAAYRFVLLGMKAKERRKIKACEGWTSISLKFAITVKEMEDNDQLKLMILRLFDRDIEMIMRKTYFSLQIQCSLDENAVHGCVISLMGRLVVRCGTTKNEDFTDTFQLSLRNNTSNVANLYGSTGDVMYLFNETEGFVHNGKMDLDIHLFANREENTI